MIGIVIDNKSLVSLIFIFPTLAYLLNFLENVKFPSVLHSILGYLPSTFIYISLLFVSDRKLIVHFFCLHFSNSEELIYASEGEGCLSVNRDVVGIVPRYARVTFTGYDVDGNPIRYRAREELSIAFQHELDHLNGILFVDKIDPDNPFKDKDFMREI